MQAQAKDTIQRKLTQADAILAAVENLGINDGRFDLPHNDVMANLWAARDLISGARDAIVQGRPTNDTCMRA